MSLLPNAVLFACSFNGVRSPMAKALMKRLYGSRLFVESCGVQTKDGAELDPFMVTVMEEAGIDMSGHKPKTFDDLDDDSFDVIISLTPSAQHRAVELTRNNATELLFWPIENPSLTEGRRDKFLDAYRRTRDDLEKRIRAQFGPPSTFGG